MRVVRLATVVTPINAVAVGPGQGPAQMAWLSEIPTRTPDGTALHLVSAWVYEQRLCLAQVAVADKSNEITAIPALLRLLDVYGALVSIDAMGCQREIA